MDKAEQTLKLTIQNSDYENKLLDVAVAIVTGVSPTCAVETFEAAAKFLEQKLREATRS